MVELIAECWAVCWLISKAVWWAVLKAKYRVVSMVCCVAAWWKAACWAMWMNP